ncbi:Mitochondrial thiamine pyrophosphate carrier 1 [Cytospora mali]|uniref:Mitochondrial thiamine pyrophosphate carrier 1 n=1 Tax=Cytospora mali TaxID=578113 RepID=A0A194VFE8_CYTMA|nr:Mitochondrial thiamine pyrophosphate carrier 1 [Valsa mali var. pyri (nom. inval.)]
MRYDRVPYTVAFNREQGSRLQVVTAGAVAGLISRFIIAPLDVIKIRLQLQSHSMSDPSSYQDIRGRGPIYKGTIQTFKTILANEGLTGLWKGNVPAELMYINYAAIQFTTYRSTTQLLRTLAGEDHQIPNALESFVSGAAAGAAATAATYPLDLLRTRFAAQGNDDKVYTSMRRALTQIYHDEGPRGYFQGLGPALGQIVPFMGAFFVVYETLRLPLGELDLPFSGGDALAGTAASVIAKTGVFPLDTVRKRIQVQGPTRTRGLTVSLFKAAPASAITVWIYERVLKMLINSDEKSLDKKNL